MNWRAKMVARLLLLVAVMLSDELSAEVRNELRELREQVKQGGELELVFNTTPLKIIDENS